MALLEDNVQSLTDGQSGITLISGDLIDDWLPTLTDGQMGLTFRIEGVGGASPGAASPRLDLMAQQLRALDVLDEDDLFLLGQ